MIRQTLMEEKFEVDELFAISTTTTTLMTGLKIHLSVNQIAYVKR